MTRFAPSAAAGIAAAALAAVLSEPCAAADEVWSVRLPKDEKVVFKGVISMDGAGIAGANMLYPAPNAVGLLAAVLTHGLIAETMRNEQKEKLQREADKVLEPYRPVLDAYTYKALLLRAIEKLPPGGTRNLIGAEEPPPSSGWLLEAAPLFALTQDHSAIILDTAVSVQKLGGAQPAPPYQIVIRVVSRPAQAPDLAAFWTANDGEKLKERSAALVVASVGIALGEMARTPGAAELSQRTVRYLEGAAERMERAEVLGERCNRLLIKNLRGWLMSVPGRSGAQASAESCAEEP
jgi:hypothetical protein